VVDPELWILETAVHCWLPFQMLTGPDLEALHNKRSHGLTPDALAELLHHLLRRGDIVVEDLHRHRWLFSVPELREMLRRGTRDIDAAYGLTEKGGARWEIEAQADWSRYIQDHKLDLRDQPEFREIICVDRDRFETYVTGRLVEFDDPTDPASEIRDVLAPWPATYWKSLPVGYRLRCRPSERRFQRTREDWARWEERMTWYRSAEGRAMS
jgi:hypothetical protein